MALEFEYRDEELRQRKRAQRIEQLKLEKEKQEQRRKMIRKYAPFALVGLAVLIIVVVLLVTFSKSDDKNKTGEGTGNEVTSGQLQEGDTQTGGQNTTPTGSAGATVATPAPTATPEPTPVPLQYSFTTAEDAVTIADEKVISTHALLVDVSKDEIVASKGAFERISPASMTKVLTVLVAAEHITQEQLDDTFLMTLEITDYSYVNDCSTAGFLNDEEISVRDLFYGTILPSGAEAAVGLAYYVAGSHETFVELMNEKLEELGLSQTAHFTNCVGLYDEEHYCTLYDMAIIMRAAMDNELCRKVLTEHSYVTQPTTQHPEGIVLSNWFLRRIEDKETGGVVIGAKTGYVDESGSCAVSYGTFAGDTPYICVTAGSTGSWNCIYDHVEIFNRYIPAAE